MLIPPEALFGPDQVADRHTVGTVLGIVAAIGVWFVIRVQKIGPATRRTPISKLLGAKPMPQ